MSLWVLEGRICTYESKRYGAKANKGTSMQQRKRKVSQINITKSSRIYPIVVILIRVLMLTESEALIWCTTKELF